MPEILYPTTSEDFRDALREAAAALRSIEIFGANSKRLMAGAIAPAEVRISTSAMRRILNYEPRDLTISVEAGMPFAELSGELARNGQMIPLGGAYAAGATIGGTVAANISESRRRGCGTARDLVIGMDFATLEGKLVRSGGMVVKNVAGLDMGKLMIGSFGTLAAMTTVNFKLLPIPNVSRTLTAEFADAAAAVAALDGVLRAGLNPMAADLLNPKLAERFERSGCVLALRFGGNDAVIERCMREAAALCGAGKAAALFGSDEEAFWNRVAAVTPEYMERFASGVAARISTPISECGAALATLAGCGHAMAANGVVRGWFESAAEGERWLNDSVRRGWKGVIEFAGAAVDRTKVKLWPEPGGDFEIMKGIKKMFDPSGLLNRGRLYGLL